MNTKCECPVAGLCQRHNVVKHERWHNLCKTRLDYFELWESGAGPGQVSAGPGHGVVEFTNRTATADGLPCIHRSSDPIRTVKCQFCGDKDRDVPIYTCDLMGDCSLGRWGNKTEEARNMPSCLGCDSRQE